jgi:DNA-directed RNA polymerase subunit RPC12/RpoP
MASFFVFKVRSTCLECGESVPFEGPALLIPCRACHSNMELPASVWRSILTLRENLAEFGLTEGQIRNSSITGGGTAGFSVGWGPQRPVCAGCGALLDLSAAPPGTDGAIRCAACSASTTTFPPPSWLAAVAPEALQIFGAARSGAAPAGATAVEAPRDQARPISFSCPDCGATLKITMDSPRVFSCTYCKADHFLPDALWRALHPVKKRAPWVVAFR